MITRVSATYLARLLKVARKDAIYFNDARYVSGAVVSLNGHSVGTVHLPRSEFGMRRVYVKGKFKVLQPVTFR